MIGKRVETELGVGQIIMVEEIENGENRFGVKLFFKSGHTNNIAYFWERELKPLTIVTQGYAKNLRFEVVDSKGCIRNPNSFLTREEAQKWLDGEIN